MAEAGKYEALEALTFMGLMAGEGRIPGAVSEEITTPLSVSAEETVREFASDMTATGDFFSFMVENGQMAAEAPRKKYNVKIVRPTGLGGGFGGTFGGGAVAAH